MLDGQGADEQLCGYLGFIPLKLKGNITQFKFLAFIEEIFAIKKLFGTPLKVSIQQTLTYLIPHGLKRFFQNKISWFYKTETESWLNKNLLGNDLLHPYETLKIKSNSVLEESLNQMGNSNLQKLLHWEDRNSMAFSIEARVPFLDHDFVEFNISLPDDAKIHNGITKRVMREALIDELPNQIKNRKDKIGFMPPEEKYMRDNPDFVKGLIKDAIKNSKGIIGDNVEVLFNNMLDNNRTFDYTFWRIIIFGAWMKKFNLTVD
jgi:asparagine synthase (glutamine-hydrolysing)